MDGRQGFFFKGWTSGWGGVEWVAFCFTNPEPRGGVTIFGPPAKAVPLLTPKPDPPPCEVESADCPSAHSPPRGLWQGAKVQTSFQKKPSPQHPLPPGAPQGPCRSPTRGGRGFGHFFFQHKKLTQTVGPPDSPPPGGVGTWVGGGVLPVLKESLSLFGKMDTSNTDMDIYMCAHAYERACVACVRACVRSWRARVCDS